MLEACDRAMIFGGTATVERYHGNPSVQAHGPGFSKILLGDDEVDRLGEVSRPDGRQHLPQQRPRLHQLLRRLGLAAHARKSPRRSPSGWARSKRCRRTIPRPAWRRSPCPAGAGRLEADRTGPARTPASPHMTAKYGPRLVEKERCELPAADDHPLRRRRKRRSRKKEYMFPFATVVECPQAEMLEQDRPDARLHRHHATTKSFRSSCDERHAHRPPQPRPHSHHETQLAAAARREYRRFPVPRIGHSQVELHRSALAAVTATHSPLPFACFDDPFRLPCPTRIVFGPGKLPNSVRSPAAWARSACWW